ncbi:carboxymuconolactone decarboxylase family protein [Actinacidiphila acidipaludis]|uniref:Carboxymuconolactone decarboxylase family protein n=1 Tax=Actinacidiphila acidipaludis TaxID=2873382 RepID=A0ABS7QB95_9ACTN|nr:carboxymuconolactone decarboxylase family protein [Streptomyces acidipaludis]MBY8880460.1 carboxymuconolactone decarboxylase family protein [Streptomyces acidipaludis]
MTQEEQHAQSPAGTGPAPSDRYARGMAALAQVTGTEHPAVLDPVAEIAPDLARFTIEFGYGDVWSRPGLTPRQRQIATVAALAALGNAAPQLRFHIGGALNVGCTRREIVETFIHATVYAGFPAALNALSAAREVFAARPAGEGADDDDLSRPGPADGDRYQRGLEALRAVDGPEGVHVVRSLDDIAPDLGRYLVEYVFGDIYARPGLDLATRELASVAMCTALGTAGPQLRVHLRAFLNVGGTREEIVELMTQMAGYAGFPAALNGVAAAREILAEHDRA